MVILATFQTLIISQILGLFLASFYIKQILDACRVSKNRHKAMIQNVSFLFCFLALYKSAIFDHFVILSLLQIAILTFLQNLVISRISSLFCSRFLGRKVYDSSRVLKLQKNVRVT